MQAHGHGLYSAPALSPLLLPPSHTSNDTFQLPLYLCYHKVVGQESGQVHSSVAQRWREGDLAVRERMAEIAGLVDEASAVLEALNEKVREMTDEEQKNGEVSQAYAWVDDQATLYGELCALVDRNFDLRCSLYERAVVGEDNLQMIEFLREHGISCKFCGSGGAIVCLPRSGELARALLEEEGEAFGFVSREAQRRGFAFERVLL